MVDPNSADENDEILVCTGGLDHALHFWDARTLEWRFNLDGHKGGVRTVSWDPVQVRYAPSYLTGRSPTETQCSLFASHLISSHLAPPDFSPTPLTIPLPCLPYPTYPILSYPILSYPGCAL